MKRDLSVVNTSMYDGLGTEEIIALEKKHSANNYAPIPVVFSSAKGVWVTDPEGKKYIDCMAGYSAVNQGHCHPDLIKVVKEQVEICTLSSRAFFNNRFGEFAEFVTKFFGYERVLPANTGTEAVEAAVKLARKWSYTMKAIPENEAIVISCINNFHGRTFGPISLSTDPDSFSQYGPLLPGIIKIPFDDVRALDECLEKHSEKVAAFLVEPIQGEAGVKVPTSGYLKEVAALCSKHNVLFIADEVQSGLGRSGKLLAVDYDDVRPDVLILGKALSGGMYPISAVLADEHIMNVITPGTHGSTFAGNPLASVIGIESLKILVREDMIENSFRMGIVLREKLNEIRGKHPVITDVRGLGLMNAIDVFATNDKNIAYTIVNECRKRGLLIKPTHGHTIRITPPLTIKIEEVQQACSILEEVCATISV